MLLRTMILLALIALVSETIVAGAGSLARAALHTRALAAAQTQIATGAAAAQQAVATAIASGVNPHAASFPPPVAACVETLPSGCAMTAMTVISVAGPSSAPAPTACPNTDCMIVLQENDAVGEGRLAVVVSTTIAAAHGAPLATRAQTLALRTFAVPPYAILTGSLDATIGPLANGGVSDDGGTSATASTTINVEYKNATTNAPAFAGNVWQQKTETAPLLAPPWDV